MNRVAVRLEGIEKRFGDFNLKIDELMLDRGFVLGLIGPNGAGKSTTIRILMNLIYPDRGQAWVLGLKQPEYSMEIKRRVGYVSENPRFYEEMSVDWMAGLVSRYYPTWDNRLYAEYLRKFSLDPRKKVRQLSRGMKVKLALTLALSHRPELLILDEPTSGIDPVVRRELLEEITNIIRDENRTVIFSSHITQDVEQVADYVVIINDGNIQEYRDKESLLESWKKVTGSAEGARIEDIRPLFKSLSVDGNSFSGITGTYSEEWERELRSRGATVHNTANLNLNEILLATVGKEL